MREVLGRAVAARPRREKPDPVRRAFVASLVVAALAAVVPQLAPATADASGGSNAIERASIAAPAPVPQPAAAGAEPSPVEGYLDATFEVFLGRRPNDGERATWAPAVAAGDLGAVTAALAVSNEWAGARVAALYETALRRPADEAGRRHWVAAIAEGETLEAIAARLYGSTEYLAASGSTPRGFLERLYADLLGRRADPGGVAHWEAALARGWSRTRVAAGFYASTESRTARVEALYDAVLGRAPDAGGAEHWKGRIRTLGDVALASSLASSPEFFRRATGQPAPEAIRRGRHTAHQPFAKVGELTLLHPGAVVDVVGFHQSGHASAKRMSIRPTTVRPTVLGSRGRGTDGRTAADIVVPPGTEVRSPVSGRVVSATHYRLYCRYDDHRVVIEPDGHPGWRVHVLHVTGLRVGDGQRVEAGVTPVAAAANVLPFLSQVETVSPAPAWPHVHVEVVDAPIGDRPPAAC